MKPVVILFLLPLIFAATGFAAGQRAASAKASPAVSRKSTIPPAARQAAMPQPAPRPVAPVPVPAASATTGTTGSSAASSGAPVVPGVAETPQPVNGAPPPSILGVTPFLDRYAHLKPHLFVEPPSNLHLGLSLGLVGIVNERFLFSANFFQVHYIIPYLDIEALSISYGTTTANPSFVQSSHFIFRSVPKYRVTEKISVGPVIGYEFVSFPKIEAVLYDGNYQTKSAPFSSKGFIYGIGATQEYTLESGKKIRINELAYRETYSTKDAGRGWTFLYNASNLRADDTPIKAGAVFLIEIGILF